LTLVEGGELDPATSSSYLADAPSLRVLDLPFLVTGS
jgi:hypothetical protein